MEARHEEASEEPAAEARPTTAEELINLEPAAVSKPSGPGTGVAVAARPSTGEPIPVPDSTEGAQEEDDDESPRQRCQAAELNIAGCARKHLDGLPRRETSLGKYILLGDDALSKRGDVRSSFFFCAKHGKEYIAIVQNKRCIHAS